MRFAGYKRLESGKPLRPKENLVKENELLRDLRERITEVIVILPNIPRFNDDYDTGPKATP